MQLKSPGPYKHEQPIYTEALMINFGIGDKQRFQTEISSNLRLKQTNALDTPTCLKSLLQTHSIFWQACPSFFWEKVFLLSAGNLRSEPFSLCKYST